MKRISLTLFAVVIVIMTSCEKEEIEPSNPGPKKNIADCKSCDGTWDITDTIP